MPTPRSDIAERSFAGKLMAIGAGLRRLILAGVSARAEAVIPAHLSPRAPPRDRRCG